MRQISYPKYHKFIVDKKADGVEYTYDRGNWVANPPMKIRYMGDLHLDYNYNHPFVLKDKKTFTCIAGDISGYPNIGVEWLKNNIQNGVFVEGNHILYNDWNMSLQDLYKYYEEKFPLDSNVSFLQNTYKVVNDIIFFGATLWTDCRYYGYVGKRDLTNYMNDYRYGKYNDGNQTRVITPDDTITEFNKTMKALEEVCDANQGTKIVVLTHHCPSEKCLSPYYRWSSNSCNQAYVSHLESFIRSHGNIVAWICGHSHNCTKFDIDGCKVLMNSRGYVRHDEDVNFKPNRFIRI